MSERAADDVRGEPRRAAGGAAAARQQQQPQPLQLQRQHPPPRRPRPEDGGTGAATTSAAAMATVGERRPLPSPEAMLGQSWNLWVFSLLLAPLALCESVRKVEHSKTAFKGCASEAFWSW